MNDSSTPTSSSKYHHPYFTPAEVGYLSEKQRGKLSVTQEDRARQKACAFLETLGARIGFPRRTIATAQNLYHRFHLFFPRKDFSYVDVSLASMYVSTKMHDTLKKPRELLAVSYAIRFPELVAKSKHPGGEIDVDTMDQQVVERDRQHVLAIERLLLETICFNFTSRMPFPYVIKLGKAFGASKKLTKLAWRLTIDCHRTLVPIQYPPHIVALANLYVAALLSSFEQPVVREDSGTRTPTKSPTSSAKTATGNENTRRRRPNRNHEHFTPHAVVALAAPVLPASPPASRAADDPESVPYNADQLIRLKIVMRQTEHPQRARQPLGTADPSALYSGDDVGLLGRNEGTVRFLFGPPGAGDDDI
ncbi:CTD kinase subunit beta [Mycena venus]|uniref:CTD kinase subunit beta n=1 Tax=Mycena venus TaxID=2733690 RepID=A0A8H6YS22_9AGAR|nr:CTD kinase subunit beta [Mycena venus]